MAKEIHTLKETIDSFDPQTGEILPPQVKYKSYMVGKDKEDDYIKVYKYTTTVFAFKGISLSLVPAILEISKYMSFAETGQLVCFNKVMREQIADTLGISIKRLDQIVKELKEADILRPAGARGLYAINPFIIGAGNATKIHELRAKFDYEADLMRVEKKETNFITGKVVNEAIIERKKKKPQQIPGQMSLPGCGGHRTTASRTVSCRY